MDLYPENKPVSYGEAYDMVERHFPFTRAWLEPRRFVLPEKLAGFYPSTRFGVVVDSIRFRSALKRYAEDTVGWVKDMPFNLNAFDSDAFILVSIYSFLEARAPTYLLTEGIGNALLDTEPPDETQLADIKFPFPSFRVLLPKGFYRIGGKDVHTLQITLLEGTMKFHLDEDSVDEIVRVNKILRPRVLDTGVVFPRPSFYVMAGMEDGQPVEAITSWDKETLGEMVNSFRKIEAEQHEASEDRRDGEATALLRLAVNILMLQGWVPDEISDEKCVRKAQTNRKGEITKTELWEPRLIGRPTFKKIYPAKPGTGTGPDRFDEVRKAHWKRQAHGPGHSLRKVIWVSLYRTRSREDRGLPPES